MGNARIKLFKRFLSVKGGVNCRKGKSVLAFDFGGGSGRAILGSLENGKIIMKEVHRFSNDSVLLNGTMYWDTLRHFFEIKQGILKAKKEGEFSSIGIDTWGVDFALLDKEGELIQNAVHYRDERTGGKCRRKFFAKYQRKNYIV